jgi:hypothetical protein
MRVESKGGFRVLSDEDIERVAGGANETAVNGMVDRSHMAALTPDYHFIQTANYTFVDRNNNGSYDGAWKRNSDGSYSYSDNGSDWGYSPGPSAEIDSYYQSHYEEWSQSQS